MNVISIILKRLNCKHLYKPYLYNETERKLDKDIVGLNVRRVRTALNPNSYSLRYICIHCDKVGYSYKHDR